MLIDFDKNVASLKNYQQSFILHPQQWRNFQNQARLQWQSIKFEQASLLSIPNVRGIYMFVVQFQDHSVLTIRFPLHGYIMYGGITGKEANTGTLRKRFKNYLRDQKRAKRVQIWSMLNKWKDDIYFHYSTIAPRVNLGSLETDLNDAVIPPLVTNDFSAEVREMVRVLRTN
jgi:hypothetical protein